MAYWRGGTYRQRVEADQLLQQCVISKTGNETLAKLMYEGVRLGGSPYFQNWYRWGYGWNDSRPYQTLTAQEINVADRLLKNYLESGKTGECTSSP